jgi:hypothetical protein
LCIILYYCRITAKGNEKTYSVSGKSNPNFTYWLHTLHSLPVIIYLTINTLSTSVCWGCRITLCSSFLLSSWTF